MQKLQEIFGRLADQEKDVCAVFAAVVPDEDLIETVRWVRIMCTAKAVLHATDYMMARDAGSWLVVPHVLGQMSQPPGTRAFNLQFEAMQIGAKFALSMDGYHLVTTVDKDVLRRTMEYVSKAAQAFLECYIGSSSADALARLPSRLSGTPLSPPPPMRCG